MMKRIGIFMLVLVNILCLMLTGCRESGAGQSSDGAGDTTTAGVETDDTTAATGETLTFTEITEPEITVPRGTLGGQTGTELAFGSTGRARISYTGNRSSVTYVTSPAGLPDNDALAQYDDAWFQDHALVLVVETVASGSVEIDISSILVEGGVASVTLSHELQGDMGTSDMATWLIWAEVEKGLELQWAVANPAMDSGNSMY